MQNETMHRNIWLKIAVMTVLSFIAMYFLMYSMINSIADLYLSVNQVYMAGSMAAAMVAIELLVMGAMYKDQKMRYALVGASILLTVIFVLFTRYQTAIGDRDFLRSMIPHHSGAILMCANENLSDPEIRQLCEQIIESQQAEINQMNMIKTRLSQ